MRKQKLGRLECIFFQFSICNSDEINVEANESRQFLFSFVIGLFCILSLSCASIAQQKSMREPAGVETSPLSGHFSDYGSLPAQTQVINTDGGLVSRVSRSMYSAVLSRRLSGKQSFVETAQQFFYDSGPFFLEDTTQPLGRPFSRAYDFRERINHCHAFIDANGEYGPWGDVVVRVLQIQGISEQLIALSAAEKAGMNDVCPNFRNLNLESRVDFWVWVMASLALFESTCGYDTTNPSNPDAVGIYQLHRSQRDRRPRALIEDRICGVYDSAQIAENENNIKCTLDFIRDGFSGRMDEAGAAGLVTRAQQFEKLRQSNTALVRLIKQFEACQIAIPETY